VASLSASLTQVGGHTLLSRLLGFVRDLLVARLFGADAATDAFLIARRQQAEDEKYQGEL
jgi:putative peptidoglycan lipid II flippase